MSTGEFDYSREWRLAVQNSAHATKASSYVALLPTVSHPVAGDLLTSTTYYGGVFYLGGAKAPENPAAMYERGVPPKYIRVMPCGTNSNNDIGLFRVWGWKPLRKSTATNPIIWIPSILFDGSFTLSSTLVGVANSPLPETVYIADTISAVHPTAQANVSYIAQNPATDTVADTYAGEVLVDLKGHDIIEFGFLLSTGAAALNALWCEL